ncbi:MAG: gamma-glutamyltransferase [Bacteroidetes bacterium]|nr:gamma-glutamyltransferase [Bacteroidota bacterium]
MKIYILFLTIIFLFTETFSASRDPVRGKNGMVVSADPIATKVGLEILKKGGNAVDAAVAVGFALAVTYPAAGNIGGGGFMNIRFADGKSYVVDYREKAPKSAKRDMYLDSLGNFNSDKSMFGYLASGVPGAVAGLLLGLEKYGTMKRDKILEQPIQIAEKGFPLNYRLASYINSEKEIFSKYNSSKKIFVKNNGSEFLENELFRQKDLAKTLKRISEKGRDGFYKGKTADLIIDEMKSGGGLITHSDLENYEAKIREPLVSKYREYEIISVPPPSSGGTALIQLLNIVENYNLKSLGHNSSKYIHRLTEAMRRAYADRAEFLGDPDFVKVPVNWLISKNYSNERRNTIDTLKATPSVMIKNGAPTNYESAQTTHYSVIDKWGNCVSVTTTLNGGFGSYVVVDGAGFLLNNEMDDFSAKPGEPNMFGLVGGFANAIEPEKRMLSSMTPTIVLKNGKPFMVVGTPGGATIITTVLQVILNVVEFGMNIQEAIDAPRIHHQWLPDKLFFEKNGLAVDVVENLRLMGHNVVERGGNSGLAEGILVDQKKGIIFGATDSRGYGTAEGY